MRVRFPVPIYPGIDGYGNAAEKAIDQRNYGLPVIDVVRVSWARINIDRRGKKRTDGTVIAIFVGKKMVFACLPLRNAYVTSTLEEALLRWPDSCDCDVISQALLFRNYVRAFRCGCL